MTWTVRASGTPSQVRASIAKQFAAQTPSTGPQETIRSSVITFIDAILALQTSRIYGVTVTASGTAGISHPDQGNQNNLTISVTHENSLPL